MANSGIALLGVDRCLCSPQHSGFAAPGRRGPWSWWSRENRGCAMVRRNGEDCPSFWAVDLAREVVEDSWGMSNVKLNLCAEIDKRNQSSTQLPGADSDSAADAKGEMLQFQGLGDVGESLVENIWNYSENTLYVSRSSSKKHRCNWFSLRRSCSTTSAGYVCIVFFPNAGRLYFRRLADIFSADTVYTCRYIGFMFPTVSLLW